MVPTLIHMPTLDGNSKNIKVAGLHYMTKSFPLTPFLSNKQYPVRMVGKEIMLLLVLQGQLKLNVVIICLAHLQLHQDVSQESNRFQKLKILNS